MFSVDRWRANSRCQAAAIAVVQVLALAVWFSVSAVVPSLQSEWGISSSSAVWLTGAVQLGFVVGAVGSAALNLADRVPPQLLLAVSAAAAALCTTALAVTVHGMAGAIPLRFLTGVCLAGVYPVGMKLMVSWAGTSNRSLLLGILIGALTLGSNLPQLIGGLGGLPWRTVLLVASALGVLGAAVAALLVRPGRALGAPGRNPRYALAMFAERGPRLSNLGYFGHMWELYALWTWIPVYIGQSEAHSTVPLSAGVTAFVSMGIAGVIGCLAGGWAADRFGHAAAAGSALAVSGTCCLLSPVAFGSSPAVLLVLCAVWGASVIADSGVFSAALSETADSRFVGTALTAQTAIGFTITVVSIQLVPLVADLVEWRFALTVLAVGPALGVIAMHRFASAVGKRESANEPRVERGRTG